MMQKFKLFVNKMNEFGIPLGFIRDPKTGKSSVSLTLMLISFFICAIGLIGKLAGQLDINLGEALTLLGVTTSLYYGRNFGIANGGNGDTVVKSTDDNNG